MIVKDYMWTLTKDVTSCILEKIKYKLEKKNKNLKMFTLSYRISRFLKCSRKTNVVFKVFFKNCDNNCATIKKTNNIFYIDIYLPNILGKFGKNSKILQEDIENMFSNKSNTIMLLTKTIIHEIVHVFDPLFNNRFYAEYCFEKNKKLTSLSSKDQKKEYFELTIEKKAFFGEYEGFVRLMRNMFFSKDEVIYLINSKEYVFSEFEKYLKENKKIWNQYRKKQILIIEEIYSNEKYLFV